MLQLRLQREFEMGKEYQRMVKKITRDPMFLAQKSVDATEADKQVITDLLDTLRANLDHCVGMAANMIPMCFFLFCVRSMRDNGQ